MDEATFRRRLDQAEMDMNGLSTALKKHFKLFLKGELTQAKAKMVAERVRALLTDHADLGRASDDRSFSRWKPESQGQALWFEAYFAGVQRFSDELVKCRKIAKLPPEPPYKTIVSLSKTFVSRAGVKPKVLPAAVRALSLEQDPGLPKDQLNLLPIALIFWLFFDQIEEAQAKRPA